MDYQKIIQKLVGLVALEGCIENLSQPMIQFMSW